LAEPNLAVRGLSCPSLASKERHWLSPSAPCSVLSEGRSCLEGRHALYMHIMGALWAIFSGCFLTTPAAPTSFGCWQISGQFKIAKLYTQLYPVTLPDPWKSTVLSPMDPECLGEPSPAVPGVLMAAGSRSRLSTFHHMARSSIRD
jgi:hypothetical protein